MKTDASEDMAKGFVEFHSSGIESNNPPVDFYCVHPRDEESENFNLLSLDNEGKLQWAKSYGEIYRASIKTRRVKFFWQGT